MKTFTLLTYSVTALIAALNISSVFAVPGAKSPANRVESRGGYGLQVNVPSYSKRNDDDKYEFLATESAGPHARRAEPPATVSNGVYVLAPAAIQPPFPGAAFFRALVAKGDLEQVYYRPYLSKKQPDGKAVYVPATDAEVRAKPAEIYWRAYQLSAGTATPKGRVALAPVANSVAAKDIARVRAEQAKIQATKTLTATPRPAATL